MVGWKHTPAQGVIFDQEIQREVQVVIIGTMTAWGVWLEVEELPHPSDRPLLLTVTSPPSLGLLDQELPGTFLCW